MRARSRRYHNKVVATMRWYKEELIAVARKMMCNLWSTSPVIIILHFCCLTPTWFFTFSSADIRFAGKKLVWMIYTITNNQAGGTFWSKITYSCSPWGLWESFVIYVTSIQGSVLKVKIVLVIIPAIFRLHRRATVVHQHQQSFYWLGR